MAPIKYSPVKFEDPDEIISIDLSIPFPSRRGKNSCAITMPITPRIPKDMYFLYTKRIYRVKMVQLIGVYKVSAINRCHHIFYTIYRFGPFADP